MDESLINQSGSSGDNYRYQDPRVSGEDYGRKAEKVDSSVRNGCFMKESFDHSRFQSFTLS